MPSVGLVGIPVALREPIVDEVEDFEQPVIGSGPSVGPAGTIFPFTLTIAPGSDERTPGACSSMKSEAKKASATPKRPCQRIPTRRSRFRHDFPGVT